MKKLKIFLIFIFTFLLFFLIQANNKNEILSDHILITKTPPNFKVAFIGDQDLGENPKAVLKLIKEEGTDMVLHQGDFDYEDNPEKWDQQINEILGPEFPYFASIGNHDVVAWKSYQEKLKDRLDKIEGADCQGDLGVKSVCEYEGLVFILSGAGTKGSNHDTYIKEQLSKQNSIWKICSWHQNMNLMQTGYKGDSTGWPVYEECRKQGAIIATGHEHSYSRTHLINNFENQTIASKSNTLKIEKGKTFAFVSGIAGQTIRNQNPDLAKKEWWASIYTADQNANFGALFCIFNYNNDKNKAHCYFKDIDGNIPDEFYLESFL